MLNKKHYIDDHDTFYIEENDYQQLIKEKNKNKNKNLEDKINILNEDLKTNKKEDKKLKELYSEFPSQFEKDEKLYSIIFYTFDENVLFPIICKNTNIFSDLENLFYEKYPYYQQPDIEFLLNGNIINKNQTLEENKTKDKDLILVRNKI